MRISFRGHRSLKTALSCLLLAVSVCAAALAAAAAGILATAARTDEHGNVVLNLDRDDMSRAGFAAMLLEALIGWDEGRITADYMLTYTNYYGIRPGTEKYDLIAEKNVKEMIRFVAGLEKGASLDGTDLRAAAEAYLTGYGMEREAVEALRAKLGG